MSLLDLIKKCNDCSHKDVCSIIKDSTRNANKVELGVVLGSYDTSYNEQKLNMNDFEFDIKCKHFLQNKKPITGKYKYGNHVPTKYKYGNDIPMETLGKRFDLVEKYEDELKKNKFFAVGESIVEIFYNPNTSSGGQFVINDIEPSKVIYALKVNNLYNNNFIRWLASHEDGVGFSDPTYQNLWNIIQSMVDQERVDIDDSNFDDQMDAFLNGEPLFEGKDDKYIVMNIMKFMIKKGVFNYDQL